MSNKPTKTTKTDIKEVSSVMAKSDDRTIQITYTIPFSLVEHARNKTVEELGKDIEVPGFRKGNAPIEKILDKIPQNTLIERTISQILPKAFSDSIGRHKIKPVTYPKFELVSANESEPWQIRAYTCEIPEINLGNHKKELESLSKKSKIWTPSTKSDETKEPSKEEKEQEVLKILLEKVIFKIPKILTDEEINSRLSQLLSRLEKLGISLESYLQSLGKTADQLREEYRNQAENSIKLEFILSRIAIDEKLNVAESEVETAVNASITADPSKTESINTPEQKRIIQSILLKRKAIDFLVSIAS